MMIGGAVRHGVVILALFGGGIACDKKAPPPIVWHHDIDSAQAEAKARGKPVVVFFRASWDQASEQTKTTFGDPRVRELLARDYVALELDASDDEAPTTQHALQRFRVQGLPTILLLEPDFQTERQRITSYVDAPRLATALRNEEPRSRRTR